MSGNRISRVGQTNVYVKKFFGLFWNDKSWKSIIFGVIISVIICLVLEPGTFQYWMSTQSGCFTLVSACIWIGVFNSIQSVCKERAILKREHRGGLHMSSYIFALMIYHSVICFVQSILMTLVCSICIKNFPTEGILIGFAPLEIFITFFLITYSADVLGLMVSSIVKTTTTAMTVMPFILIFQLVLSGTSFELTGGSKIVANAAISKWGMQAIGSTGGMEDGNMFFNKSSENKTVQAYHEVACYDEYGNKCDPDDAEKYGGYDENGTRIPKQVALRKGKYYTSSKCMNYDATSSHLLQCWGLLVLFTILYCGIAIFSLQFIDKDKR